MKMRKREGKKPRTPTYNLTLAQIEGMKKKAVQEATETAWVLMLGLPLMELRDDFGFGKTRLSRHLDGVLKLYESFEQGYFTLQDVLDAIYEETGTSITKIREDKKHK